MEISRNSTTAKRKNKKTKNLVSRGESCVNPEHFDGMSNWIKLQKLLDVVKEKVPEGVSPPTRFPNKQKNKNQHYKKMSVDQTDKKPQFKFDFIERKSALVETDKDERTDDEDEGTIRLTKSLAMDCEMVGTGHDGKDSILARVSIVNCFGDCVYDTFVKPTEKITDYRTEVSGVREKDLRNAKDLFEVQKDVVAIIEGRRVVGHDLKHDFKALLLSHPKSLIRDTAKYKPFRTVSNGRTPSLKKLTAAFLDCNIQENEHSSIEDAKAAMLLYLMHKKEWEKSFRRKRR